MTCDRVRSQLTAYLDGELADERGSAVRGHLRGCAQCRQIATDESTLRDGLRALPTVDPPGSLWAGVQARLAAEEVADAERPAWRRVLARWLPSMPQLALGSAVVAAAVVLLVIRHRRHDDVMQPVVYAIHTPKVESMHVESPPAPPAPVIDDNADVTDAVAAAPARVTEDYAAVVAELMPIANEAKARLDDAGKREFEARLAALEQDITTAKNERARQRQYRSLIRFLQRVAVRDDVALASTGGTP
jgi:hypothetical protein